MHTIAPLPLSYYNHTYIIKGTRAFYYFIVCDVTSHRLIDKKQKYYPSCATYLDMYCSCALCIQIVDRYR